MGGDNKRQQSEPGLAPIQEDLIEAAMNVARQASKKELGNR
jgi:hypothetical protein